jgi:altronate hydrolase
MKRMIKIHPADSVVVALEHIIEGDTIEVEGKEVVAQGDIPQGHKMAIQQLKKGDRIKKYGASIGIARCDIVAGDHVHMHNLNTALGDNLSYSYQPVGNELGLGGKQLTFKGYLRTNGDVGIRNELWIVPTVGCVNGQARMIADRMKQEQDVSHIDDVVVMSHQYGCSQLGGDHVNTQKALAGLIKHPNAGGVLVLGLGCENNQISELKKVLGEYDDRRILFLAAQDVEDEIGSGVELVSQLVAYMKVDQRTEQPVSKLKIGLKCGGSDGFSGITANPLLGRFSDWLIAEGGTTVLTEVPEMFGAETLLMNRAQSSEVFEAIVTLINGFKDYFRINHQPVYENPSPGNKKGGITTLEEKSLGCVQKGGQAIVNDVLEYGQTIKIKGLNLLWSPGNDLVATSALGFSGCQMVLFTTGRGTPFGSFMPTLKIASNSKLFQYKRNWMDFNAGILLEGTDMEDLRKALTEYIIKVAEGQKVKHEISGFKEISIFKSGVTL